MSMLNSCNWGQHFGIWAEAQLFPLTGFSCGCLLQRTAALERNHDGVSLGVRWGTLGPDMTRVKATFTFPVQNEGGGAGLEPQDYVKLFADDVVVLASSPCDLQHGLQWGESPERDSAPSDLKLYPSAGKCWIAKFGVGGAPKRGNLSVRGKWAGW